VLGLKPRYFLAPGPVFEFNVSMGLPVYQHINIRSIQLEDLKSLMNKNMNLNHPVVLNLKLLDLDQQREIIRYVEEFFEANNLSFKFPYPVYLVTDHESIITQIPIVKDNESLPRFFTQRESKLNVKESHVISRNHLLQQEINNADIQNVDVSLKRYGQVHRQIFDMEKERLFYRSLLHRMMKGKKNG
jgi:hypothetical protein